MVLYGIILIVVSVTYKVEVEDFSNIKGSDDAKLAKLFNIDSIILNKEVELAFDHFKIISEFRSKL